MANDYLGQAGLTALIAKIKTAISTAVSGLLTKSDADGYYQAKGNIPKSDLASDVQTSLGKADTALQSYTESDPTVPLWAKASSKPTYTASEVGAAPSDIVPSDTSATNQLVNYSQFQSEVVSLNQGITNAINGLDVSSVGGSGKYIQAISETDGKISATAVDFPNLSAYKRRYYSVFDAEAKALSIEIPWDTGTFQSTALIYGCQNGYPFILEVGWSKSPNAAVNSLRLAVIYSNNASNQIYVPKVYYDFSTNSVQKMFFVFTGTSDYRITTEFSCNAADYISVKTDTDISDAQSKNEYNDDIPSNVKMAASGTSIGSSSVPVYVNTYGTVVACSTDELKAGKDADGNKISSTYAKKASVTAATKCKITYNSQGIVTGGSDLSYSDIPYAVRNGWSAWCGSNYVYGAKICDVVCSSSTNSQRGSFLVTLTNVGSYSFYKLLIYFEYRGSAFKGGMTVLDYFGSSNFGNIKFCYKENSDYNYTLYVTSSTSFKWCRVNVFPISEASDGVTVDVSCLDNIPSGTTEPKVYQLINVPKYETVGSSTQPVYSKNGELTACSTMATQTQLYDQTKYRVTGYSGGTISETVSLDIVTSFPSTYVANRVYVLTF